MHENLEKLLIALILYEKSVQQDWYLGIYKGMVSNKLYQPSGVYRIGKKKEKKIVEHGL